MMKMKPLLVLVGLLLGHTLQGQESVQRFGIKLTDGRSTHVVPSLSEGSVVSCVAELQGSDVANKVWVCALGHSWSRKGAFDVRFGATLDSLVFLSVNDGKPQIVRYHQPGPTMMAASPDGRFVAFANSHGWTKSSILSQIALPSVAKAPDLGASARQPREASVEDFAVGTLRYSIWSVWPARLEWEMRFYEDRADDASQARFVRSWEDYAKATLPWWAIRGRPVMYKHVQMAFSPGSEYFVALDYQVGIHILRIEDGLQCFRCVASPKRRPVTFCFDGSEIVRVLFSDGTGAEVRLESGEQREYKSVGSIPQLIEYEQPDVAPLFRGAMDCRTGLVVHVADRKLRWALVGDGRAKELFPSLERVEVLAPVTGVPCRLESTVDGSRVGVRYSRGFQDIGDIQRYDVIDLHRQRVKMRVSTEGSWSDLAGNPERQILVGDSEVQFDAAMSRDGSRVVIGTAIRD